MVPTERLTDWRRGTIWKCFGEFDFLFVFDKTKAHLMAVAAIAVTVATTDDCICNVCEAFSTRSHFFFAEVIYGSAK